MASVFDLDEIKNQLDILQQTEKKVLLLNYTDGAEFISISELRQRVNTGDSSLENLIDIRAYDSFDDPLLKKDMVLAFDDQRQKFVPKNFFSKIEVRNSDPAYHELFDGRVWIRGDLLDEQFGSSN